MSQVRTVSVKLLDKEYAINCPDGAEAELIASADLLDSKMREIRDQAKLLGLERIAVMAGLNLAHELMQASGSADTAEAVHSATVQGSAQKRCPKESSARCWQGLHQAPPSEGRPWW